METVIPARLATLGHPQRLAIFRLLMRRFPDRLPAGEIAAALDLRPSTLSAYLAALVQAGLVTQERAGTLRRYGIDMDGVQGTFDYLLRDCCRGRPGLCLDAPRAAGQARRLSVLFVCTANSARSIMAEAILRDLADGRFAAASAGTSPAPGPHPLALELLARRGHETAGLQSRHVDGLRGEGAEGFDFVITVCDRAANEDCPAWPGQPLAAHWGVPDPVAASQGRVGFEQAYDLLAARIRAFAALPFARLDPIALQHAADEIGRLTHTESPHDSLCNQRPGPDRQAGAASAS
ncbi:helix-turn-helix domain-containing protein [Alkalilacustris brevis]|uniref:arsenate reductase/protein-tyrosine-phosphatase family protein n=1 Tax=Alkalilacustris brevis TaxID=2026338 RepID=UPI000E0DE036|nr:helix-turn-helix domain-containing protein [Alkalilacustris brevis]